MGISSGHFDWTMVPYVRKSFYKHYKDGLKYIAHNEEKIKDFNDTMAIDCKEYCDCEAVYSYAMAMTEKELHQAVEGLLHNLK